MAANPCLDRRSCGLLLHPTSLPGRYGCGDAGPAARHFIDRIARGAQSWWQMLPVGPVDGTGSPYQSISAFAGNELLISPADLRTDRLLVPADLQGAGDLDERRVDYAAASRFRNQCLHRALNRFNERGHALRPDYRRFCRRQQHWLDDLALFCAVRARFNRRPWHDWPAPLRDRKRQALQEATRQLADDIERIRFGQFLFDRQWRRLRHCARAAGASAIAMAKTAHTNLIFIMVQSFPCSSLP